MCFCWNTTCGLCTCSIWVSAIICTTTLNLICSYLVLLPLSYQHQSELNQPSTGLATNFFISSDMLQLLATSSMTYFCQFRRHHPCSFCKSLKFFLNILQPTNYCYSQDAKKLLIMFITHKTLFSQQTICGIAQRQSMSKASPLLCCTITE